MIIQNIEITLYIQFKKLCLIPDKTKIKTQKQFTFSYKNKISQIKKICEKSFCSRYNQVVFLIVLMGFLVLVIIRHDATPPQNTEDDEEDWWNCNCHDHSTRDLRERRQPNINAHGILYQC